MLTTVIGAISFFVKSAFSRLDNHETDIKDIKEDYVKESRYQRDMDKVMAKLDNVVSKDDFIREVGKLEAHIEVLRRLMTKGDKG